MDKLKKVNLENTELKYIRESKEYLPGSILFREFKNGISYNYDIDGIFWLLYLF